MGTTLYTMYDGVSFEFMMVGTAEAVAWQVGAEDEEDKVRAASPTRPVMLDGNFIVIEGVWLPEDAKPHAGAPSAIGQQRLLPKR